MSAEHTLSPWIIKPIPADQGASPHFIVESADINAGDYVAEVYSAADARLIAAAPALKAAGILALEAIDNILGAHEGQAEWAQLKAAFDALEAAIAKAEGRQ